MAGAIRLGRLWGIRISADWSLIFLFWLLTVNLALGLFPAWHPQWSATLCWVVALGAGVLFLASVLAHELAHALVARRHGIPVGNITLFLFGGVANIERDPRSPGVEAVMAVVGPLTSLSLGVAFLWAATLLGGVTDEPWEDPRELAERMGPLATLLAWLGPLNISLAIFNMVPGFPLDGGRVLRAVLWHFSGSLSEATRWAARAGQVVALTLVFLGLAMMLGARVPLLGTGVTGGLWLVLVGWFLHAAAAASYEQVVVQEALADVPVRRLMRTQVATVGPELAVVNLVDDFMLKRDHHAFPVVDSTGFLLGLVSLRDVRALDRTHWMFRRVRDIMTPVEDLVVVAPDQGADEALQLLARRGVSQLPVVEHGRLVGMLWLQDVVRWLELEAPISPSATVAHGH
ncbi:MAG: site-2 protease family protein [Myxococcota bacterium]